MRFYYTNRERVLAKRRNARAAKRVRTCPAPAAADAMHGLVTATADAMHSQFLLTHLAAGYKTASPTKRGTDLLGTSR